MLADARARIRRVGPAELAGVVAAGGLVVDIRPQAQREAEGHLPGALVIERNVLEWRFDLQGAHHLDGLTGYDQPVVIACSEGYTSSLAAASLKDLGYENAADLEGGYRAWEAWQASTDPKTH
jgi:rhodanese-related sulfurtransferase